MKKKIVLETGIILSSVAIGGFGIVNIYLFQWLIDALQIHQIRQALNWMIAYMIVILLLAVIRMSNSILIGKWEDVLETSSQKELLKDISKVTYQSFEDKKNLETIDYVWKNMVRRNMGYIKMLNSFLTLIVSLIGCLFYLFQISWVLPTLTIGLLVPSIWLMAIAERKEMNTTSDYWTYFKRQRMYSNELVSREYAKEVRIYNTFDIFQKYWEKTISKFHKVQLSSNLKERFTIGGISILQFIISTLIVIMLFPRVKDGTITLGVLLSGASSLWQIVGRIEGEVYSLLSQGGGYKDWIHGRNSIMRLPKDSAEGKLIPQIENIELRDVYFHYPDSEEYVLRGVSFVITANENIALVGPNGSGKSTIIKLILGLLEPDQGEILINGLPANSYNQIERLRAFECVFQDYVKYNLLLGENVAFAKYDSDSKNDLKNLLGELIPEVMAKLPDGLATPLGKIDEKGIDLSGGQWQKIAIARAAFEDRQIAIFDEPTASLDPLSEISVYQSLLSIIKKKPAIIVTHRLGLVKYVNKIIVLKEGRVIATGSHDQLMKECFDYEEMYNSSKEWIEENA